MDDATSKTTNHATTKPVPSIEESRDDSTEETAAAAATPPISKNQLKRARRLEKMMEKKKRRKEQDKQVKQAKAKAEGRDIEQERKLQEAGRLDGANRQKRMAAWQKNKVPLIRTSFEVVVDCGYEKEMTSKEINSLAMQLRYCYSVNKRHPHPCQLHATGVVGETARHLSNVSGHDEWSNWAFTVTADPFEHSFARNTIVYLTSDSDTVLTTLEDNKVYVIGGIVDRNRLTRAAHTRATTLGVATARLPIDEHLVEMAATRVLTCNHVFHLLLQHRHHGGDWKKALRDVLPSRKDAIVKDGGDSKSDEEAGKKALAEVPK